MGELARATWKPGVRYRFMGRAAIGTAFREDKTARKVTLSKRKKGIYKKCQELSQLCGVHMAIICVGDYCKPSSYVTTPEGPKEDLAGTYHVVQRFSDAIGTQMPLNEAHVQQASFNLQTEQDLTNLRLRCMQLEEELNKYRSQAGLAPVQAANAGKLQPTPEILSTGQNIQQHFNGSAPEAPSATRRTSEMINDDLVAFLNAPLPESEGGNPAVDRLSGRLGSMNISLDMDALLQENVRMSLDNDVRRVSREHDGNV